MRDAVIVPIAYLAPVSYYCRLLAYDDVRIEQWEHYIKQTYRNRCVIASESGPLSLSIPVEKVLPGTLVKEVRVSDHGNWRHMHWQALSTAYDRTPYFEFYADDFRPFYEKKYHFLFDYTEALRELICHLLDISPSVSLTQSYMSQPEAEDCWMLYTPKAKTSDAHFSPCPYYQVFSERCGFLPNLSVVDLLFNMGPESVFVLRKSFRQDS